MPGQPVQLSGPQYKAIGEALMAAFDYDSLERLLQEALGQRLDLITSKYLGFTAVVWQTLRWAEGEGCINELVAAAKTFRLGNDLLQALPTEFAAAAQPDPFLAYHKQIVADPSSERYQIDRRFVRLTLLLDQGPDAQGLRFIQDPRHHETYDNLATLLDKITDRAVVLLGKPGSGKTTLLRRLQLEEAWEELDNGSGRATFFISLNGYRAARPDDPLPDPLTWLAAQWHIRYPSLPPFEALFHAGRLRLLLDGLNEMPHRDKEDYRSRIGNWQQFLQQTAHYGNTVLFSCRSLDYSAPLNSEAVPVRQVNVEPLTPGQIEAYLNLHLGERAGPVWATLRRAEEQLRLFSAPFFLRLLADEVAVTGEVPAGQAALLTGFVRRALKREIERGQRLFAPDSLLSETDVQQVIQDQWPAPTSLPVQGPLIPQLSALAYNMQDGRRAGEGGQVRVLETVAQEMVTHPRPGDIISAGLQLNVLDKELATGELLFFHQLIQEYFAARILSQAPEPARVAAPWQVTQVRPSLARTVAALAASDPLPGLQSSGWEETTILAAALAGSQEQQEQFVAGLLPVNLPLAARCAAAPEVDVSPQLKAELQQALLSRIGTEKADLRARIAAAEALGELGDPRFQRRSGPHGDYLQPPLVAVAGGVYRIGSAERSGCNVLWQLLRRNERAGYEDEKPAHDVPIAAFAMGMFPVTNAEYRLFIEAGGYEDERWWTTEAARAWRRGEGGESGKADYREFVQTTLHNMTDEAIRKLPNATPEIVEQMLWLKHASPEELERQLAQWYRTGEVFHQPEFWEDSRFNHPAQPVVGVSWFEAQAYCVWLAAQTGQAYRLPTEVEWEAAARGRAGRAYAYGRAYDAARCNTFESHIRCTTPVGVYPGGQTPEGIADLSGNVWEWTSSEYRPYRYDPADGREELEDAAARRVLRGGSWSDDADLAPAASRVSFTPAYRGGNFGFRLVVVGGGGASSPIS